jgi:hypothetical protein
MVCAYFLEWLAMSQHLRWLVPALLIVATPISVCAEQVRFRFVPIDACGTVGAVPVGPERTIGELRRGLGVTPLPYPYAVRPNRMVTFRHSFTGRLVTVPMRLPDSTPRMEHATNRIIYNYNDYTVEARFLPDGSIDVVYNSGLLRPLRFD